MSLEMAHKVIVPQKKIMSRSFLNSGTLIVRLLQSAIVSAPYTDKITIHANHAMEPRFWKSALASCEI
jgi:hypothetical protein